MNNLRLQRPTEPSKFYQKLYFIPAHPLQFSGVLVSQICLLRNERALLETRNVTSNPKMFFSVEVEVFLYRPGSFKAKSLAAA